MRGRGGTGACAGGSQRDNLVATVGSGATRTGKNVDDRRKDQAVKTKYQKSALAKYEVTKKTTYNPKQMSLFFVKLSEVSIPCVGKVLGSCENPTVRNWSTGGKA
jgi:hypothetical protein